MGLVLLNPLGLDVALGSEENSVLKFLFEFDDKFSCNGEENSVGLEVNCNEESRLSSLLRVLGDLEFLNFSKNNALDCSLEISGGVLQLNEGGSNEFFNLGEMLTKRKYFK